MTARHPPRSRAVRRISTAALALSLSLAAVETRADESTSPSVDSARVLADEGANAFAEGDYARAHDRLQRAFSLFPAPTIAVLDARALARLGRLVEAAAAYRQSIAAPVDPTSPPAFRDAVVRAEAELASLERRLPRLTLRVVDAPRGARVQVWLDGAEVSPRDLGRPLAADPKGHSIRLDIEGKPAALRNVSLREGESRTVELELPAGDGLSRAFTIAGFGLAGAGIATGVVAGSLALSARKEAERGCPDRRCERGSEGAQALGDFRTYRVVSSVGYGVGAAGAVLGTVLLLSRSSESGTEVGVAPSFGGVELRGRF
jgi:hypothetical protein